MVRILAFFLTLSISIHIAAAQTPEATPAENGPTIAGCPVFPADNPWNQDISAAPVDPKSDQYIAAINESGDTRLHADFGSDSTYGFPYTVAPVDQPKVPMIYTEAGDESDPGPFPIPADARIEAGTDRHVIVIDSVECKLYELYNAYPQPDGSWQAGSGALFDLRSNLIRPDTWTSADQSGMPIFPGLVRHDEIAAGAINHALRFTVWQTQRAFIHPATHFGSVKDPKYPPMGLRLRLKADFDMSRYTGVSKIVLTALKTYGMFVADTGTSWYISGENDPRWNDDDLNQLKTVPGEAFEVVKAGEILYP